MHHLFAYTLLMCAHLYFTIQSSIRLVICIFTHVKLYFRVAHALDYGLWVGLCLAHSLWKVCVCLFSSLRVRDSFMKWKHFQCPGSACVAESQQWAVLECWLPGKAPAFLFTSLPLLHLLSFLYSLSPASPIYLFSLCLFSSPIIPSLPVSTVINCPHLMSSQGH